MKAVLKFGVYPTEDDGYHGYFVYSGKRRVGFIYDVDYGWAVYGIDLGADRKIFPSKSSAAKWVLEHKPGLTKATKARTLKSTYSKLR
jgi:hypothetical protein